MRSGHGEGMDFAGVGLVGADKELRLSTWEEATDVEIIKQVIKIRAKPSPRKHVRDQKSPHDQPNKHQIYFKLFILTLNKANCTYNMLPSDYHKLKRLIKMTI